MRSEQPDPGGAPRTRRPARWLLWGFLAGALSFLPVVLLESSGQLGALNLAMIAVSLAILAIPFVVLCWMLLPLIRGQAPRPSSAFLLAIFGLFLGLYAGARVALWAHRAELERFAARTGPVIDAIERYVEEAGEPPPALDALVPAYLPSVPGTGYAWCPEYRYGRWEQDWWLGVSGFEIVYRYLSDGGWREGSD